MAHLTRWGDALRTLNNPADGARGSGRDAHLESVGGVIKPMAIRKYREHALKSVIALFGRLVRQNL